jgi:hypothetical protein
MAEPLTSDGRVATRGAVQRRAEQLIRQGLDNQTAAEICRRELGGRTTPACIAWYRTHMRKGQGVRGKPVPGRRTWRRWVSSLRSFLPVR